MNEVFLRPLTVGELLDKAFRIYRKKFATLIGIVAVVLVPESILRLLIILYAGAASTQLETSLSSFLQIFMVLALVVYISHTYLEKEISLRDSYSQGLKRFWSVFGANFLVGVAIGLPLGIVMICLLTAGAVSILAILAWLPVAVYISTRWSLAMPAILLENIGASEGLKRSWDLTKDNFWRVMGTSFAAGLLTILITTLPILFADYLFSMTDLPLRVTQIIDLCIEQVAVLLAIPFSRAVIVLIYYDLRIRKEGFDLEVLAVNPETPIVAPS